MAVARIAARFTGRAVQARMRCARARLLRQHGAVVVATVRAVPLVDGHLARLGRGFAVGHHAGRDGGLQPRGTEQREHRPGKGALSSSEPCEAEVHAVHLWRAGVGNLPLETLARKQECRRSRKFAEHTYPAGRMAP